MPSTYLEIVENCLKDTLTKRDDAWKDGNVDSAAMHSLIIFVLADLRAAIEREDERLGKS